MEGRQGHQGGHHRGDRCQGQVRSPVDHPARTWEVLSNFVLLPIFLEAIVVVDVDVDVDVDADVDVDVDADDDADVDGHPCR